MRTETQAAESEMMFELDHDQIEEVSGGIAPAVVLVFVAVAAPEIEAAIGGFFDRLAA